MVLKPSQMAESGWEALTDGRMRSGGPPAGQEVVESPSRIVARPSWRAWSSLEALLEGREAFS